MDKIIKSALKANKLRANLDSSEPSSVKTAVSFPNLAEKKPIPVTHFFEVKNKVLPKSEKNQARSTVVFHQGSSTKKNLAYYDPEIYELLKQRKQTQVGICRSTSSSSE